MTVSSPTGLYAWAAIGTRPRATGTMEMKHLLGFVQAGNDNEARGLAYVRARETVASLEGWSVASLQVLPVPPVAAPAGEADEPVVSNRGN